MATLTETGPKVYVTTMIAVLSNYYAYLVETLNHMKGIKLKDHPGQNVADFCDGISVYAEYLDSDGALRSDHLGHIIHIFEDSSNSRFHIWDTQKNKDIIELIKKSCVCNEDFMRLDEIINYGYLV